ncbi:hypothetical protein [Segetibacter aerophilus]|uniref:Uncharacterized protein n=1 Tax=Segetibacter aerophilus TaxID=670293 RepID=A0A512B761_9BACT|nr:hypothetical protein [Segetibacter aerophilus]GEO07796.1 hypothetical protein SAE01_02920 [Segetibacter aerophilus]
MKHVFVAVCLLVSINSLRAQENGYTAPINPYVFPTFVEGTAKQKSGEVNKALFNYNTVTEEMIFDQGGKQLALDKIENIDTVYIEDRKFIPFGNVFYEVATTGKIPLFIQHKMQLIPPGNNSGLVALHKLPPSQILAK